MKIGPLDRRISILRAVVVKNTLNEPIKSWPEFINVWASVTPISDGERYRAAGVGAEVTDRFQVRYSSDAATVGAKDRIDYDGKTYDITGVKPIGRRNRLEITAKALAD